MRQFSTIAMVHLILLAALGKATLPVSADDSDLAQQLTNPVASLISVPIQYNFDQRIGATGSGTRHLINVQPVVPFSLDAEWNLISRTIVPIVAQDSIFNGSGSQFGLGDTVQSFFLSPKIPQRGIIWGVGPVMLLPTGTDRLLTTEKWGVGPTAVVLTQIDRWTFGALANHIWSVAGDDARPDISATFLQPFVSYTTADAWTFALNTESTYDWTTSSWSVPINFSISKLTKIAAQPVSLGAGIRYWAESPAGGPEGLGVRATMTFLFPTSN